MVGVAFPRTARLGHGRGTGDEKSGALWRRRERGQHQPEERGRKMIAVSEKMMDEV